MSTNDEAMDQLKKARLWLAMLIEKLDIDPGETSFNIQIVKPDAEPREYANLTLADSLAEIDAVIARSGNKLTS